MFKYRGRNTQDYNEQRLNFLKKILKLGLTYVEMETKLSGLIEEYKKIDK